MTAMQSKGITSHHKKRYRLKKVIRRIRERIRNLVDDLHHKCIAWMVHNFTVILLPLFEPSRMVVKRKGKWNLSRRTKRDMLTWSHSRFRTSLLAKIREFEWCKVVLCNESYTSKTCGSCGVLHQKLGGNKGFHCSSCGLVADRDQHASRNIWLKYLTD